MSGDDGNRPDPAAGSPDFGSRTEFYTFAPETLATAAPDHEVLREVGKGSMGIVYEVRHRETGARAALKVLPPSLTLTERALARFLREGEIMARIRHPAIVRVLDQGRSGRLHWFVMEYVEGTTLEQRLEIGPLPGAQAAALARDVARALQFAHDQGVVHRDIKPGNLMQRPDGSIAITDFGLARETGTGSMTESGAIIGTPMFMAPEVVLGERTTPGAQSDVYGLGATLYTLLTGRTPFVGPTAQSVLKQVLEHDPTRPRQLRHDLPADLEAIVLKAMEKDPARRYATASDLADDLDRFLAGDRVLARRPGPLRRLTRVLARHPLLTGVSAVALALAVGAYQLERENRYRRIQTDIARAERALAQASAPSDEQLRPRTANERDSLLHEAAAAASAAIAADPGTAEAWFVRAKARLRMQDHEAALADLDRYERLLGHTDIRLLHFRIETLGMLGHPQARRRLREDLATLLEQYDGPRTRALVSEHLLELAGELTGPDRAETLASVERVLSGTRDTVRAQVARARLHELRGETEQALEIIRRATHANPGDLRVQSAAAEIFARLGRTDEARAARDLLRALETGQPPAATPEPEELDREGLSRFLDRVNGLLESLGGRG